MRSNASEPESSSSAPRSSPHRSSAPHVATLQPSLSGQERHTANRQHARHSSHTWRNPSGVLQCPPWTHRQGAGSRQRAAQTFSCSMRGFAGAAEGEQQSAAAPAEQAFTPPGRVQNTPAAPWTPTQELRKRNFLPRRMGHLMQVGSPRVAPDKPWQRRMSPSVWHSHQCIQCISVNSPSTE